MKTYRVLDPACGSGNFLFLGLKALKDIEHKSHLDAVAMGLDREADLVTGPHNVLGIELNEYAAELARVTVWIGELQWRIAHGYEFKTNPVLEPLEHIECRDALLTFDGKHAVEAQWPKASVVMSNPPFLGDKKMRSELGDEYTTTLRRAYEGRVPGGADLVCYWFEKARAAIETQRLGAAGLVATNSIRGGKNRVVLDAIAITTRIYEAWSDEAWVNDGAAVRVSLLAFGHATQQAMLDGVTGAAINSDLSIFNGTASLDTTLAKKLASNRSVSFQGPVLIGDFEVERRVAEVWLKAPNPNGLSSSRVLRPISNGKDINSRSRGLWVVDFGRMDMSEASLFELPFAYVQRVVKPVRATNPRPARRDTWWQHGEHGGGWRTAVADSPRFIATSQVSKHRCFAWLSKQVWPHQTVIAFARADDTTFGILHSRFHELWSLRMGTSLEDRPRYTPTTCFETFPFPVGLSPADTAHQRTEAVLAGALVPADLLGHTRTIAASIAIAAKNLNDLREHWLNPPEWTERVPQVVPLGMDKSPYPDRILPGPGHEKDVAERTLTKLYNQRPAWLDAAHKALDVAVAAAYGWSDYTASMTDEEILKRLLALNLQRAGQ